MAELRRRIVIVGGTSGIAEACARLWAERGGADFALLGRSSEGLAAIAADLRVRDPAAQVDVVTADLADPETVDATAARFADAGVVLIAFGALPGQAGLQADTRALAESLHLNAVAPVLWAEAFARAAGNRTCRIAVIGSVAGDRGRKTNYAYGAAKSLLATYVEGMQHRFPAGPVIPVIVKPGPTATAMTRHLPPAKLAPVAEVAALVVAGIEKGSPVIYAPAKWRIIMAVLRHMPRFVFNRLDI